MSAALVRQALEFVDPDESKSSGTRKRNSRCRGTTSQEGVTQQVTVSNKIPSNKRNTERDSKEIISKLLKLSETTVNKDVSEKIVKRIVSGKPLFDKIEIKQEEQKSILFPEDEPTKKKNKNKKRN